MKIKAIRLKDVGLFDTPVALEGFSGGFDVLVGRNESGKSTILRAFESLFKLKHTSTAFDELRPYRGGEPCVEADFEALGKAWRLTKQFGRGRSASLIALASGKLVARNSDVDAHLQEICGPQAWGARGLLWVHQTVSLKPLNPSADEAEVLTGAVAREISGAAGGFAARAVRQKVNAELDALVTPGRRTPRAGGRLHAALADMQRLRLERDRGRQRVARGAAAAARLGELRRSLAALMKGGQPGCLDQSIAVVAAKVVEGARARDRLKAVEAEVTAKRLALDKVGAALVTFDGAVAEIARVEDALAGAERDHLEHGHVVSALESEMARVEIDLAPLEERITALRAETAAAEKAESARLAARRLEELCQLHAEASSVLQAISTTEAAITANPLTAQQLAKLEMVERDIRTLRGRLDAAAPRVEIAYDAEAMNGVVLEGAPLPDGAVLRPLRPMTLRIPGVGAIRIVPASAEGDVDGLARHESLRMDLLAHLGVPDIETASLRHAQRRSAEAELAALRARLGALVPAGMPELETRMARERRLAGDASVLLPEAVDVSDLRSRQRETEAEAGQRRLQLDGLRRDLGVKAALAARVSARVEAGRARFEELTGKLPPLDDRKTHRDHLASAHRDAMEGLSRALTDHSALAATAPSTDALEAYRQEEAAARRARVAWDRERLAISTEVASLEGQISGHDGEDASGELYVRALEGDLERTQEQVTRLERQVAVLSLLDQALEAAEQGMRDHLVTPVMRRLAPYVDDVLPGSHIRHASGFAPAEIIRDGTAEPLRQLSHGTQEQIAILARLGLARLLSDNGSPLPLILDDALVYSDDERICSMMRALERAAEHHQVIVLTCRAQPFTAGSATHLHVGPWAAA